MLDFGGMTNSFVFNLGFCFRRGVAEEMNVYPFVGFGLVINRRMERRRIDDSKSGMVMVKKMTKGKVIGRNEDVDMPNMSRVL